MELFNSADILMRFILALSFIFGLIALSAWLAKLCGFNPTLRFNRNTTARLQITDTLTIDNNHKLVLVKRDNVEHFLCLGGQHEFVVEQNIQLKKTFTPPKIIKKFNTSEDEENAL